MKTRISTATVLFIILFAGIAAFWGYSEGRGEESITVTVQPGDTILGIANKYLKNPAQYKEILKINGIENPNLIKAGMKLKIPTRLLKEPPHKKPPTATPKPVEAPSPEPASTTATKPEPKTTTKLAPVKPKPVKTTPPKTTPSPPVKPAETPQQPAEGQPASVVPPRTEPAGVVFYVAKDVVRTNAGGADETLRVGSALKSGDRVVTDTLSFYSVSLDAGRLVVGPDTRLVVEQIGKDDRGGMMLYIKLIRGSVRADSPANFDLRVRSEVAVARAKGAMFTFRVEEEGRTFIEIYSGKVDVTSASTRNSVTGGQGVVVDSGGVASAPQSMPPAPVLVKREVTSDGEKHQGATWKQTQGAVSFRVEVASDSYFEKPIYFAGYAGDSIDFNFLLSYPSGRYYIRLISVNQNGLWSAPSNAVPYTPPAK